MEAHTGTHQRSFERYHPRPPLPKIGGSQPHPKTPIGIIPGIGEAGLQIWPEHSQGVPEHTSIKILEKRERGRIHGLSKFLGTPNYLGNR